MGDRCTVTLYMRKEDLAGFGEAAFESNDPNTWADEQDDEGDGIMLLTLYEANYACTHELERAARAGFAFYGLHGAGDEYGPSVFAALDGKIVYAAADYNGKLIVPYGGDARDARRARADARLYTVTANKVRAILNAKIGKESACVKGK